MTPLCLRFFIGVLLYGLVAGMASARQALDTVITGGQVYKMPSDTVVGITAGKFSYLGSLEGAKALLNRATHHIDANGASIYPSFIELHTHLFDTIAFANVACKLNPEDSLSGVVDCTGVNQKLNDQQWLIGSSEGLLDADLAGQTPRQWLDSYFPERPVVICEPHSSVLWLNSKALKRMMINQHSVDPVGGTIVRTLQNQPNGILVGSLAEAVLEKALATHQIHYSDLLKQYASAAKELHQYGVTSIGEAESLWKQSNIDFWEQLEKTDQLDFRISVRPRLSPIKGVNDQLMGLTKIYRNDLSSKFLINQIMLYVDGQYQLGTARLSQPYRHPIINTEPKGLFYFTPTELNTWLHRLEEIGYGAYIHAEGDAAVEAALYSIQNARRKGDDQRFILTGMHLIKPEQYPLFSQNAITASFRVDVGHSELVQGESSTVNSSQAISIETLLGYGTSIALSSGGYDRPFLAPLVRISQNLKLGQKGINDIDKAIDSYTIEPAKALGIESVTGSIVIGKSADIVIIDKNLATLSVADIAEANVLLTMLQGEVTFSSDAQHTTR